MPDIDASAGATAGAAGAVVEIARVFREQHARGVAVLTGVVGHVDPADEALSDAIAAAVQSRPASGNPPNPAAWIIATARNRAIDRLRREASRGARHAHAATLNAADEPLDEAAVQDDQLRLIFTCCH